MNRRLKLDLTWMILAFAIITAMVIGGCAVYQFADQLDTGAPASGTNSP